MELPAIKIPEVILPFDIPVLMHPPVDHFVIALPIIILFIEFINLFAKKRAIGVVSFLLLILTVVAAAAAYYTGGLDAKEAFPLLSEAGQGELKEHKLLGTWLLIASAVVLVFKLLSAMIGRGIMKALYLVVLILFVAGILKQGKEGGELVYKYGANVEAVQELDSELFDVKEELEELQEETKASEAKVAVPATATKETPDESAPESATSDAKEAPVETAVETETPESVKTEVVEVAEEKVEEVEVVTEAQEASETAAETTLSPAESAVESVKTEVVESIEVAKKKVEEVKVEVIPQVAETPQIATH